MVLQRTTDCLPLYLHLIGKFASMNNYTSVAAIPFQLEMAKMHNVFDKYLLQKYCMTYDILKLWFHAIFHIISIQLNDSLQIKMYQTN